MALILCIDTALDTAYAALCRGTDVLAERANSDQKTHATFIQPAIHDILKDVGVFFRDIDAVAVVNGPGSYTGLRVGLATAKGICYAANKPLVLLNTLQVMALAAVEKWNDAGALYCPMIDARRNEVFTALYDGALQEVMPPQPVIIDDKSFEKDLAEKKMYFFGGGHKKCGSILKHENAVESDVTYTVSHVNQLARKYYVAGQFADIAYSEPFYTKEFYTAGN